MDMERSIKRLAIILVASLVIIMIAKAMLIRTANNLGHAVAEKHRQGSSSQTMSLPASSPAETPIDTSPEASMPASAVQSFD
jgi:hypothetical protein